MPPKRTSSDRAGRADPGAPVVAAGRTDGRSSRWDGHRAARREELIAAAVAAVHELGAGVSMDDIAAHSGIAKPVYYRYFADKADLHSAVGRAVARDVVGRVTAALDRPGTARARLAAGIDAYVRSVEADPELYRFVVEARPSSRSGRADPLEDFATLAGLRASQIFGDLLRLGGADAGAAETWGFGLVGMVRTAADRWMERPSISREALVDYLTDLVMPGISAVLPAELLGDAEAVPPGRPGPRAAP
jgi:AcrR family transcriptional regulator